MYALAPRVRMFWISSGAVEAERAGPTAQRTRPRLCVRGARLSCGAVHAAGRIRALVPGADVVLLAAPPDADGVVGALRAGVAGFVLKDVPPDGIIRALEAVGRGEVAV